MNIQDEPEIWQEMSAKDLFNYYYPSLVNLYLTVDGVSDAIPTATDFLQTLAKKHPDKMIIYNFNHYRSLRLKVHF